MLKGGDGATRMWPFGELTDDVTVRTTVHQQSQTEIYITAIYVVDIVNKHMLVFSQS